MFARILTILLLALTCNPVLAQTKPSYEELEKQVAELQASKARVADIANKALTELEKASLERDKAKSDLELSNKLISKLNELVQTQDKAIESGNNYSQFLKARLDTLLEIATSFEKEVLTLKGQNQAYSNFVEELRQNAGRNQKALEKWQGITTRKHLPSSSVLREDFLSLRWRFKTFHEDLQKSLEMLDESLDPNWEPDDTPEEKPQARPDRITS